MLHSIKKLTAIGLSVLLTFSGGTTTVASHAAQPLSNIARPRVQIYQFEALEVKTVTPGTIGSRQSVANNTATGAYYSALTSSAARELYKGIISAAEKGVYVGTLSALSVEQALPYAVKLTGTLADYSQSVIEQAAYAVTYDHLDLFEAFLSTISTFSYGETYIVLTATQSFPYESMRTALSSARTSFLSGIDCTGKTQAEIELAIHDALITQVKYDSAAVIIQDDYDTAHTAYGALVEHSAVCDGYSQAFSYLLEGAGIDAYTITGRAGKAGTSEDHAWSLVRLDDQWYEVDATWDDQADTALQHEFFNQTTSAMSNKSVAGSLTYHIRDDISNLMPTALGTTYTYENILTASSSTSSTDTPSSADPEPSTQADQGSIQTEVDTTTVIDIDTSATSELYPARNAFYELSTGEVYETKADGTASYYYIGRDLLNSKTISIPATVTIYGFTYRVTAISASAFYGAKKLKTLTLPASIQTIDKQAFKDCKQLKKITMYGTNLTSVGAKAFSGINSGVKIKIIVKTKAQYKAAVKLIKKAGAPSKTKFKKVIE